MPMRYDPDIYKRSMDNISHAFTKERSWVYFAPTDFYGGCTSFSLCFKGDTHPRKIDKQRVKDFQKNVELKYYNHGIHHSSLTLPPYVKQMLDK